MAKGKLSNTEKYAIQGMLQDGKTHREIAVALGRTTPTVTKYVNGELNKIQETVAEIATEKAMQPDYKQVKNKARKILTNEHGMSQKQANDLTEKVATKIRINGGEMPTDPKKFARLCTQNVSALELTGTHEGEDGEAIAAVMNKAASMRGDEARNKARRQALPARTTRGAIFNPKQGKMKYPGEDEGE